MNRFYVKTNENSASIYDRKRRNQFNEPWVVAALICHNCAFRVCERLNQLPASLQASESENLSIRVC